MTQRAAESLLAARFMPLAFPAILTTITGSQNARPTCALGLSAPSGAIGPRWVPSPD